jgi:hypothetical protein
MLLAIKIGVFYGAPIVALLVAVVYFVVLFVRVRRGAIDGKKAAVRYSSTLLLPVATLIVVWSTAELAGYFAVPSGQYAWDGGAAVESFTSLLPLAAYVGMPIAVLVVLFWLVSGRRQRSPE